ncbi:MAG TPA: response regulator [Phycisphaerales bacterium]|nr:response regulator [Phycisphaerales bacterium]
MKSGKLEGKSILIVDDDEDILTSIDLVLHAEGATTRTAVDGNAAISMCHTEMPDAVVLDMMLPRASGFLVLEKLRELASPPVVVMVTANQGKRHMEYARTLGVHAYMTKPLSLARLVSRLAELFGGPATTTSQPKT